MRPKLYVFTISHYCEKARWALDYLNIDYELKVTVPGSHLQIANKLGLERGSTPFLQTETEVIQGSDKIIDWAEQRAQQGTEAKSLAGGEHANQVRDIEARLDEKLGVHVRRWYYSEAIPEYPEIVKPIFMHNISAWEKLKLSVKWPVIQTLMTKRMDLGHQQGLDSYAIVQQEIHWLESLLTDKELLVGDQLTRADIAAASLLAPVVKPAQHPSAHLIKVPPRATEQSAALSDSPLWDWVHKLYSAHRLSKNV